jgi:MGT family glycosyltransferase
MRFLFAAFPVSGHVNPGLPIARELVARGHDVRWYSTRRFKQAIEATGARWVPFRQAMAFDEQQMDLMFPDRPADGIAQIRYDVERIFVEIVRGQTWDLTTELTREPADVIVTDNASGVGDFVSRLCGIPWAVYGILPLTMPSADTAPFGLALMPSQSILGRLRNKLLYKLVDTFIFDRANALHEELREEFGLAPSGGGLFDLPRSARLYLQACAPSFEYPRADMPPHVRFVGASIPPVPRGWQPPQWWHQLDGARPVVLLTQGTINNDFDQLIRPAIRALANKNVLVVVTTGSKPEEEIAIDPLPSNVRVERFIPYAALMPKVDLLLTNGGYGSIQIALAHGVPVVAIGKTEDKPEIANRVQWSGAGLGLKVRIPKESQILDAVRRVLRERSFRARAEAMRDEMAGLDAAKTSADLLEELAAEKALAA